MRRYLRELNTKPDHHKRRFAIFISGITTLFIFGVWSLATFGTGARIIADKETSPAELGVSENEVSPFESFRMSLASSFAALRGSVDELKTGLEAVNLESEYTEMKGGALDVYGE